LEFKDLTLGEPLLKAIHLQQYTQPTPIQQQAIPVALLGKDLLACAQTGTGKTAAFALPILQLLYTDKKSGNKSNHIKALIITPTRELALQIEESFANYGVYTGLKTLAIFGGVSQYQQVKKLQQGVDILIATPGRLLDLAQRGYIKLQYIKILVLDEADRMLDMGFVNDVRRILGRLPAQKQILFFSATMPPGIIHLSQSILRDPVRIEITPISTTAETVEQAVYFVQKSDKRSLLIHLLKDIRIDSALIFTQTKYAARGIDIESLSHVINFELPNIPETYVHRIGRTGRAGASGIAISFCGIEERMLLRDIHKLIAKSIPVVKNHPYEMAELAAIPSNSLIARRPMNRKRDKTFRQR
jgi:ATP-dependent RNA helicase RhlE